jgi:nicotinate phosphoribosyltransferase
MQNAVIKLFPRAKVRYKFIDRGATYFPKEIIKELKEEISLMSCLKLTKDEADFLVETCYYLDPTYIDFLKGYRYNPDEVKVSWDDGELSIEIEGYWYRTILWEVPLLALVSQLYFEFTEKSLNQHDCIDMTNNNKQKAERLIKVGAKFADFGTRRRYSYTTQDFLVEDMMKFAPDNFVGTSNVHFAMMRGTRPIGTQAHEWFMFHAARYGFKMANRIALDNWVEVYRGDLGIALTDTFTSENFFENFDKKLARLFDGIRHDSGDPTNFALDAIKHYLDIGIDPMSKTIVFSDGLNVEAVERLQNIFRLMVKTSYGIGTHFTNDVGVVPLNIVIKMSDAKPDGKEWIPVIKLSDNKGKHTGDKKMIKLAKQILGV